MKKQYNERPTTIIVWLVVILAIIVMIAFTGIKPACKGLPDPEPFAFVALSSPTFDTSLQR